MWNQIKVQGGTTVLESLFTKARFGDMESRNQIIEHYMSYACAVALRAHAPRHIGDELPSIALEALVGSIDYIIVSGLKADSGPQDNDKVWRSAIAMRVKGAIKTYRARAAVISCSWQTYAADPQIRKSEGVDAIGTVSYDTLNMELDEIIQSVAISEIEIAVLGLLIGGVSGPDICATLELKRYELSRIRQSIRERYQKLFTKDHKWQNGQKNSTSSTGSFQRLGQLSGLCETARSKSAAN